MTDVHLGYYFLPRGDPGLSLGMKESVGRFADTIQDIKDKNPDFILITGDLVEYNDESFFMAFTNLLKSINIPVYITPGNHDRRNIGFLGDDMFNYNTYIRPINPSSLYENDYVFDYKGYRFIGLDSGADYNAYYGNGVQNQIKGLDICSSPYCDITPEAQGLSDIQKDRFLEKEFKNNIPKIIFMHSPVMEFSDDTVPEPGHLEPDGGPGGNDGTIGRNRLNFINYARDNNVQLVLTGHSHNYSIFDINGQPVDSNSLSRPLFIQTQSATKDDNKNGNEILYGYRMIDIINGKATPHNPSYTSRNTGKHFAKQYISLYGYPYNVGAYDSQGRYTGISDNCKDIILNIPDSYYTGNYGGGKIMPQVLVAYTDIKEIKVALDCGMTGIQKSIQSTESTSFNMSITSETSDYTIDLEYYNVSATANSKITIDMANITINYNMSIDTNNDGTIDGTVSPDSISFTPSIRFINGTVMDSINKTALPGVTVSTNTNLSNTTNATGFYSFAVTEGEYNLTAKFEPTYYANNTITVSTIGNDVVQDIELLKKPMGTITGKVTGTPEVITVVSPNGGEDWKQGTFQIISWTSTGNPGNVNIELLKSGVSSTIISNTVNDGSHSWTIPSSQTLGNDYKIRITSAINSLITDTSDNNFVISAVPTSITIATPNGGENWRHGTTHTITWSTAGSPGPNVKIELLRSGTSVKTISSSTANDGSYSWAISSTQTVANDYKIGITSTSNSSYKDISDNNFIIST